MTMNTYILEITPDTELSLGNATSTGNFQETLNHIPGSMLRGATAASVMETCCRTKNPHGREPCEDRATCDFWQLFGADEPLFGAAYPSSRPPVFPPPLTGRTCKSKPGIDYDERSNKTHGMHDVLLVELAYDLITDTAFPERPTLLPQLGNVMPVRAAWLPERRRAADVCAVTDCGDIVEPLKPTAFYNHIHRTGSITDYSNTFDTKRMTHVGINRARAIAADGLLFNQGRIEAKNFYALVSVSDGQVERLKVALDGDHFIGRGRSRGTGRVTMALTDLAYPTVAERLTVFNEAWRETVGAYTQHDSRVALADGGHLFSLTLRSPAIFAECGIPQRVPTAAMLGLPTEVTQLRAWARTEVVGGWNQAAGLPRRTQMATRTGSVFVYYAPASIPFATLVSHLEAIENNRIGLDRERGYGVVTVCAAIHTERRAGKA